jgi:AraC family transcriptional regulator
MLCLSSGQFHGETNRRIEVDGLIFTDTEYTRENVPWHYHENAYFTFILDGLVIEGNKKDIHQCPAGSLLFHNWQEPHYNFKPPGFTRGFHVELNKAWFAGLSFGKELPAGSLRLNHPTLKILMYQLFSASKLPDELRPFALQSICLRLIDAMCNNAPLATTKKPAWVSRLDEHLQDAPEEAFDLKSLASDLGIHPVHLCRDFPKYFHCNLGDYIRQLRLQKACTLLPKPKLSLTQISLSCGFADQSHFIRNFKKRYGITPSAFRNLLLR